MNILLVEDEAMSLKTMEHVLMYNGFNVYTATNGKDGLKSFYNNQIDLIICDIMMPHMSGLELLDIIKNDFGEKIPIIITSSLDATHIILRSYEMGAMDFMIKPINYEELLLRIKRICKKVS